jgi:hypothetical protein
MGDLQDKVGSAKAWYKSKAIIGIIIAMIPTLIQMVKPDLVLDLKGGTETLFNEAGEIASQADTMISQGKLLWAQLSESIGAILTVVGIRTAKKGIK